MLINIFVLCISISVNLFDVHFYLFKIYIAFNSPFIVIYMTFYDKRTPNIVDVVTRSGRLMNN